MSGERKVLVRDFSVSVHRQLDTEGVTVVGWSGWFARSSYTSSLPVTNGQVMSMAQEFPESKWQVDEDPFVKYTVDDTWVTLEAKNEHALRLACNYLLTKLVAPKDAAVKMRRTWRFNVYEEQEKDVPMNIFDDNDDW